ncbi:Replication factor A protein 1 [Coniosporium tulheliwenetii]|uniref:Replication factor A protein 1 n=1 Tax=Coniosporium tulheliwenetii TaxID=3383036 RepID=A0ACC2ZN05_9PEZI|nr:Replication factor A protein 1 [Cladosporium sp. JES 115]
MSAEAASHITQGALRAIFDQGRETVGEPVVQAVQIKPLEAKGDGPERYRVVFSDMQNFVQSMIAEKYSSVVSDGTLKRGAIVRLIQYTPNVIKGKKILIVGEVQVLLSGKTSRTNASADSSANHGNIYPIEALSPYSHKWTIKARVTYKSPIKTWHKQSSEGKLFSVNLLDESGEIKMTGFNAECDAWYNVLQEGSVYYISSPCKVNMAKKQFSNLNNDYELVLERDTVIEAAPDQSSVPQVRFNFTSIGDLESVEKNTTIDTIGVLQQVGEVSEIVSKTTSKPYAKRELTLVDNTNHSVRLTIWGDTAHSFDAPEGSAIAFKGVKVSDFGGRSLSLLSSGSMTVDPDIDEAHKLKGWYDAQGRHDTFQSFQNMGASLGGGGNSSKTIQEVKDENLGMNEEKPDYFNLKATVVFIKQDNIAYPACLSPDCNKKVVEVDPGQWRCEKCDKTHPRPQYRYMMSINVSDHTGQMWLSAFDDHGRLLLGMDADQIMAWKEEENKQALDDAFQAANCRTYIFRCRAKMDNFQDQQRVNLTTQKRLAASVAGCGKRKIWMDPNESNELSNANSRNTIRKLLKDGLIIKKPVTMHSRARARALTAARRIGRHRGFGKRKGTADARMPSQVLWMRHQRVLRRLLVKYRASGKIDKHLYHELYALSKGNTFKHKRALVEHIHRAKAEKQRERIIKEEMDAKRAKTRAARERRQQRVEAKRQATVAEE